MMRNSGLGKVMQMEQKLNGFLRKRLTAAFLKLKPQRDTEILVLMT